ncbi:DALR anticodon-binding domain-containing protein [Streptomyces sp. MNU103]|uniref:DALR anticodon-binding domain-containing protein n=1 Tax=Streptomyces sp. MNU103 TaxID=2560024 RepID=UPI001E584690|nr:hypothetical protein [Streptomyces sp. MNU103]
MPSTRGTRRGRGARAGRRRTPGPGGCGDYATNVALQLARPAGQPAPAVAELLRTRLLRTDGISDVVVTGPGFLNISLAGGADARLVRDILRAGPRYGHSDALAGQTIELHAAPEVRALVLMDSVARVLRSQGARPQLHCTRPPEDAWVRVLGVPEDIRVRPGTDPPPRPRLRRPHPLGRDTARWALLHPPRTTGPASRDEHLVQRESNPLFRVRYAHARSRAVVRNAADLGFGPEPGPSTRPRCIRPSPTTPRPRRHRRPPRPRPPRPAPRRRRRRARALLPSVLPLGDEKPSAAHRARLALAEAAGTVLAGGLTLLGIDAPEHL